MAKIVKCIEQLPVNVMEEIFSYVPDRRILRSVSKNIKDIVDNSPKLMKKYGLNMNKMEDYQADINSYYQLLKFEKLNFEEFKCIQFFQHKERIKEIYIMHKGQIEKSIWFMQCILFNFDYLQRLHIDLDIDYSIQNDSSIVPDKQKLLPNKLPNLESLEITTRRCIDITDVLNMFADIPSIKKLTILNWRKTKFPQKVAWKLEELNICIDDFYDDFANDCKKFVESQKTTLKVFRNEYSEAFCNFIMHNLPDLELLHLRTKGDKRICDDLSSNDKLKSLSLCSFSDKGDHILEKILRHYKNIEYLNIRSFGDRGREDNYYGNLELKNVQLLNLTHLSIDGFVGNFLLGVKMPNLKILEINYRCEEESCFCDNFDEFPAENFANIEKLSVNYCISMDEVFEIAKKCPKLQHLNVESPNFYEDYSVTLKEFVKQVPQLKYFGILKNKLGFRRKIIDTFYKIHKKRIIVKLYDEFEDMMKEYWALDMIGDFQTYCAMNLNYKELGKEKKEA